MASPGSLIGRTLGHYRILQQIGAGGMGVVYRAQDERLERDVALKVLPPGTLADDSARKRFRQEALALSRLNHPNIATVFDFDTQEGIDFLVTELVPGVTLDEKLVAGPLLEKEILQIGQQMADGLEAAHHEGVVHRDLKPGNLRLTPEGRLKILDFGLAKRMDPADQGTVTQSFSEQRGPAGTLAYMAPEQLKGEKVDARADIWAAGVVLYELATGRRPFEGQITTALADEILHAAAPSPQALQPRLPARLVDVILKCLEKDAENRYQSAKELVVDLRRLGMPTATATTVVLAPRRQVPARALATAGVVVVAILLAAATYLYFGRKKPGAGATSQITSLAVLPLANLSGDANQEYFADGMTEALITDLSKIKALKVISRTSVMQYKGVKKPLPEIARELGVNGILEGSALRSGDQVRITVELIDATSDTHLWGQTYDRDLRDVLAVHREVAQAVAHEVSIKLSPQEAARLAAGKPVNPEAYDAYLKGRNYWNKRTVEDFRKSLEFFNRAIELDPAYAPAYAGLADAYTLLGSYGAIPMKESHPRARAAAMKALEIDEQLGEAHASLATIIADYYWDWGEAEKEFQRAIQLSPNYAVAHYWYASYLMFMGRFDEALTEARRAEELDPLDPIVPTYEGIVLYRARRYNEAITQLRRVLQVTPDFAPAHSYIGLVYIQKHMFDEAVASFRQEFSVDKNDLESLAYTGYALGAAGKLAEARRIRNELQRLSTQRYVSTYDMAVANIGAGENDRALDWLEKGYQERSWYLGGLRVDPLFDPLRSEPRFQDLLRRMNFPP